MSENLITPNDARVDRRRRRRRPRARVALDDARSRTTAVERRSRRARFNRDRASAFGGESARTFVIRAIDVRQTTTTTTTRLGGEDTFARFELVFSARAIEGDRDRAKRRRVCAIARAAIEGVNGRGEKKTN